MNMRSYLAKLRARDFGSPGPEGAQMAAQPLGNQFMQRELRNPSRGVPVGRDPAPEVAAAVRAADGIMRDSADPAPATQLSHLSSSSTARCGHPLDPAARAFF